MANTVNRTALIAGREKTTVLQVVDANGAPINMANSRVYYMSKNSKADANGAAIVDVTAVQPDDSETQNGYISYTIPAAQVPIALVADGDLEDVVYGLGYQLSAVSDRVEISEGKQPIIKGVDNNPVW